MLYHCLLNVLYNICDLKSSRESMLANDYGQVPKTTAWHGNGVHALCTMFLQPARCFASNASSAGCFQDHQICFVADQCRQSYNVYVQHCWLGFKQTVAQGLRVKHSIHLSATLSRFPREPPAFRSRLPGLPREQAITRFQARCLTHECVASYLHALSKS